MRRYKTDDFWELRKTRGLRRETKNYVPLIHAAIVVAKAPERYGFIVVPEPGPDFERVPIEGAFDLRVIAECAGEPVEAFRSLNPELRRLATPADRTFALRVPAGRGQAVADCVLKPPRREARELPEARGAARPDARRDRPRERGDRARRRRGEQPAAGPAAAPGHRAHHPHPGEAARRPGAPREGRPRRRTSASGSATGSSRATPWPRSPPSTAPRCASCSPGTACRGSRIAAGAVLTIYTAYAAGLTGRTSPGPLAE